MYTSKTPEKSNRAVDDIFQTDKFSFLRHCYLTEYFLRWLHSS